jgi:hypothetical protein
MEKWGILDGKDESGLMSDSKLQGGSPPPVSIKDYVGCALFATSIELCTDAYEIYGVLQT